MYAYCTLSSSLACGAAVGAHEKAVLATGAGLPRAQRIASFHDRCANCMVCQVREASEHLPSVGEASEMHRTAGGSRSPSATQRAYPGLRC